MVRELCLRVDESLGETVGVILIPAIGSITMDASRDGGGGHSARNGIRL